MEKGTVKFFVPRRFNEGYGFIVPDCLGKDVYFSFLESRTIKIDLEKRTVEFAPYSRVMKAPVENDRIIFERAAGAKGYRACPWSYLESWEWAVREVANLPAPTIYRVLKTMNKIGSMPLAAKVIWEGTDLSQLIERFPLPKGSSIDPITPYYTSCGKTIEVRHWFEKNDGQGWARCPDPRVVISVNRQIEQLSW